MVARNQKCANGTEVQDAHPGVLGAVPSCGQALIDRNVRRKPIAMGSGWLSRETLSSVCNAKVSRSPWFPGAVLCVSHVV